ncbi:MAG: hypothetical protein Q7S02_05335 [bacterium]|nr:hypothetical protein [bacterium]
MYAKNMLAVLADVERALPQLLNNEAPWQSLDVDYEPPRVERLWRDVAGYRVYLHRIHPVPEGTQPLFHPHPWPSAIRILEGTYEMPVGYGTGEQPPPVAATLVLPAGTMYEMVERDAWHSVRPIEGPVLSLMVTGAPWDRWSPKPNGDLGPLSDAERDALLTAFREHYRDRR